ncbi:MAG: hypothetical protein PUP93_32695 [Rhizonema sp. NSF051]|nr:hypothetical protein [Rhizonema sp. NSF051]
MFRLFYMNAIANLFWDDVDTLAAVLSQPTMKVNAESAAFA